MSSAIVVYDTHYGNTKTVAEAIAQGISEAAGPMTRVSRVHEVQAIDLEPFDVIALGSPNHVGRPTRRSAHLAGDFGVLSPRPRVVALFDTCYFADQGKACGLLERSVRRLLPTGAARFATLSVLLETMDGPLNPGEVERSRAFGRELAALDRARAAPEPVALTPRPPPLLTLA